MSFAFLIMDDGGWVSGSKSVRISTNNFTLQEVELIAPWFQIKLKLEALGGGKINFKALKLILI